MMNDKVPDVHSICIIMLEDEIKMLEDHFKIEQRTKLRNGFWQRRFHFKIVILGLIDAAI